MRTFDASPPCTDDPDLWFSTDKADQETAKRVCATCPFRAPCEDLGNGRIATPDGLIEVEFGVWAGKEKLNPNASYYRSALATGTLTPKQRIQVDRAEEIRVMLNKGMMKADIGRRMNLSHGQINNIIDRYLADRG